MTRADLLANIPLFAHLDDEGRRDLLALMTPSHVPSQEAVFWFGDKGDTLFVIEAGAAEVTAPDTNGDHVLLAQLGPGDVFGELGLLDGAPRSATVRAVTDLTLLGLSRDSFHAFLRQRPDVAIDLLQLMGARQRASTATIRGLPNPNRVIAGTTTVWQRVSDVVAGIAASQYFTLAHLIWFSSWILLNTLAAAGLAPKVLGFDPYPFGLLTLIVSLEAIFLSIFVLVSQNRQAERDRISTDIDHQVNVKAHLELVGIGARLDRIEALLTEGRGTGAPPDRPLA